MAATTMPSIGTRAPPLDLKDQDGRLVSLDGLRGGWVVLYFYPKDDTPGCTREACNFRDNHNVIRAAGATVLGVSGDNDTSHTRFASKYSLPFSLLHDPENRVARAYGAWGTKNMYGRSFEGIIRSTFIIDPAGKIAHVWPKVKPDRHGEEVLGWLQTKASS